MGIAPNEVQVEGVGRKQAGYIPADELSATGANPADLVKIGDELDLLIMRTNDQEGTIMLSKRRVDALKMCIRDRSSSLSVKKTPSSG